MSAHQDRLVILDEIHRAPGLSPILRGLVDRSRRAGRKAGQYLLLGSASLDLLRPWAMLAHNQGGMLNSALLARNLGLAIKTINSYLDLLLVTTCLPREKGTARTLASIPLPSTPIQSDDRVALRGAPAALEVVRRLLEAR